MPVKIYENGLVVIVEENAGLRSVTAGIMVGAGSAYETPDNNGISHFIEHTQFKGTSRRSAEDIVREFDEAGSVYNAFTGKEYTCYYFKSIDENMERCFDVLSDLFLHSAYDGAQLDRERKVILEEINMSKDEPDGVCYDLLYRHIFDGSLGMEILGTKDNVSRFSKDDIVAYKSKHYIPANTVVAFVGNIKAERAYELVEKYMPELVNAPKMPVPVYQKQTFRSGYTEYIHDYEQSEISVAYPAFGADDERAVILSALDCILGNGMSSRMFQRIREQMGLCYSVYTSPWMGGNKCGVFTVCANVNAPNAAACVKAIKDELNSVRKSGVTQTEVDKAKTLLKVNALFGKENPMNYMLSMMRRRVLLGTDYDLDELLERIEGVTVKKVNALARELFSQDGALAYVGKATSDLYDEYKKA